MYVYVLGLFSFFFNKLSPPSKLERAARMTSGALRLCSTFRLYTQRYARSVNWAEFRRDPLLHTQHARPLTTRDVTTRGRSACVCRRIECKRGEAYEPQTLNDRRTRHMYRQTLDVLHWTSSTDKARWN